MPWRVFGLVGLLVAVTAFTALNLDYRADVSIGIHTFRNVPIFLTSLISLTLGALLAVPFTLPRRRSRRPVPQPPPLLLSDESEAATATRAEGEAPAPQPPGEPAEEAPVPAPAPAHGSPEPAGRKARRWPLGRRKERPD